jgi:protein TonB
MKQSHMFVVNFFSRRVSYVLASCFLLCMFFSLPLHASEKKKTTADKVDQKPARFPGGEIAWNKYLDRVMDKEMPSKKGGPPGTYTVVVSFIIDKTGAISEITAENDPGYGTKEEALKVIKKGPKWVPAEKDGQKVIYRHRQSIEFVVK